MVLSREEDTRWSPLGINEILDTLWSWPVVNMKYSTPSYILHQRIHNQTPKKSIINKVIKFSSYSSSWLFFLPIFIWNFTHMHHSQRRNNFYVQINMNEGSGNNFSKALPIWGPCLWKLFDGHIINCSNVWSSANFFLKAGVFLSTR